VVGAGVLGAVSAGKALSKRLQKPKPVDQAEPKPKNRKEELELELQDLKNKVGAKTEADQAEIDRLKVELAKRKQNPPLALTSGKPDGWHGQTLRPKAKNGRQPATKKTKAARQPIGNQRISVSQARALQL
jgi:hypothetical protein